MKRKHQIEMEAIVSDISNGRSQVDTIYINVTPGGGKSVLPLIAGRLITAGLADGICWVVPRNALQDQGERSFLDPYFRKLFKHDLSIRSSTNEFNPMRDQSGFITTYQAIGMTNTNIIHAFKSRRMILVLDEFHHVEKDGVWHEALAPIMDLARFKILMTGTLGRGDNDQIAFLDYQQVGKFWQPVLEGENKHLIEYKRPNALKERAIIPLKFHLMDGDIKWKRSVYEEKVHQSKLSSVVGIGRSNVLYAALETQFALDILNNGLDHWRQHNIGRKTRSKFLVVTANYEHAEKICVYLRQRGNMCQLATSHDSSTALSNIHNFKFNGLEILVTIAMAYEGLDVPQISHIICLTNIRSTQWIEQMIARAVRIWNAWGPYETQVGHIFAPDDIAMHDVMVKIEAEQLALADKAPVPREEIDGAEEAPTEEGAMGNGIIALEGAVTGTRVIDMGHHIDIGSSGEYIKTIKEQEMELREGIERHVRKFAFKYSHDVQRINAEIKAHFQGVPRADMSLNQLKQTLSYIENTYPIELSPNLKVLQQRNNNAKVRGSGIRFPTKAIQVERQLSLFDNK